MIFHGKPHVIPTYEALNHIVLYSWTILLLIVLFFKRNNKKDTSPPILHDFELASGLIWYLWFNKE